MLSILHKIPVISWVIIKSVPSNWKGVLYPYLNFKFQKGVVLMMCFALFFKILRYRFNVILMRLLLLCYSLCNFLSCDWHYHCILQFIQSVCKCTWVYLIALFPVKFSIFSLAISGLGKARILIFSLPGIFIALYYWVEPRQYISALPEDNEELFGALSA